MPPIYPHTPSVPCSLPQRPPPGPPSHGGPRPGPGSRADDLQRGGGGHRERGCAAPPNSPALPPLPGKSLKGGGEFCPPHPWCRGGFPPPPPKGS